MNFRQLSVLAALLGLVATSSPALAVPISATETIVDPEPFELFSRDLQRTRSDSNGFLQVENNDATIIAENNVDGDFGITNFDDVSFRHNLTWLNPAAGTYLVASLTIQAFANIGGNDVVLADTFNLGALTDGTIPSLLFSTTSFTLNPVTLNAVLGDGYLDVVVDKNASGNFLSALNAFSVFSSSLTVRYEPVSVPEPGTMLLLSSAGLLGLARRRKLV